MDRDDWARRTAAGIGERVAHYRDQAGLTAQQLAERCAERGMPSISRTVVTKLENGRREAVSTAELQVLAAALGVPAAMLLFGLGTEETIEVLPGAPVEPYDAIQWFTGETTSQPIGEMPEGSSAVSVYTHHQYLVSIWHEEQQRRAAALKALNEAQTPEERREAEELADLPVTLAEGNTNHLRSIRATMRKLGWLPPRLPPEIARAIGEESGDGSR